MYRIYTFHIKVAYLIKEKIVMLEEMKKMIAEQLSCDENEINLETSFKDDLGADSLDLFELVMALEDEYNIEIPAEELADLATVGDVIEYLKLSLIHI